MLWFTQFVKPGNCIDRSLLTTPRNTWLHPAHLPLKWTSQLKVCTCQHEMASECNLQTRQCRVVNLQSVTCSRRCLPIINKSNVALLNSFLSLFMISIFLLFKTPAGLSVKALAMILSHFSLLSLFAELSAELTSSANSSVARFVPTVKLLLRFYSASPHSLQVHTVRKFTVTCIRIFTNCLPERSLSSLKLIVNKWMW